MDIAGKVALVTERAPGSARPAPALAAEGAQVMVADLDDIGGTETVRRIEEDLGDRQPAGADVSFLTTSGRCSRGRVVRRPRHVHNNAGLISGEPIWPESELERILKVITVNLGGVAMGTQQGIQALRKRGGGWHRQHRVHGGAAAHAHRPVYSATKVGVVRITESCAGLAEEGIRSMQCSPAWSTRT